MLSRRASRELEEICEEQGGGLFEWTANNGQTYAIYVTEGRAEEIQQLAQRHQSQVNQRQSQRPQEFRVRKVPTPAQQQGQER